MEEQLSLEERIKARSEERKEDPQYYVNALKVDFAEAVARQLEATGISRAKIAERLGTSRAYVTKMLNEVLLAGPNLTMQSMARLAFALRVKIEPRFIPLHATFLHKGIFTYQQPLLDPKIQKRLSKYPAEGGIQKANFQPLERINIAQFMVYQEEEDKVMKALVA